MNRLGIIRTAAISPKIKIANTDYNTQEILKCAKVADARCCGVILFPELSLTGYTCADLFYQELLYQQNLESLQVITEASEQFQSALIVGFYLKVENNHYNCAALIHRGKIKGIVPKMFIPDSRDFYEPRWFAPGIRISEHLSSVSLFGEEIPFGNLLFHDSENEITLGIEVCQDLWTPVSPGSMLALNGAQIIFNPSASNEAVGKSEYRHQLVKHTSSANICGYVYASSGVHESTTDTVYGGDCVMAENGSIIAERPIFKRESAILYGEIDYEHLRYERAFGQLMESCASAYGRGRTYHRVELEPLAVLDSERNPLMRTYPKNPFIPNDPEVFRRRCHEIFQIQTAALAKRFQHSHAKTAIVGISGGLDSTLALLVTAEAFRVLGRDPKNMIAVTMPGFGTTGKTYNNALTIMRLLGATVREISIKDSVNQHFKDIGQDPSLRDVTYENAQARERTQILMDISNQTNGLVVGTGDLSEVALGWSTYNGDHMSMYGVNCSVPKTVIPHIIHWIMDHRLSGVEEDSSFSSDNQLLRKTLQDIMDTPISPELLPPDENGEIAQKTEDTVGPYILHDFFLFYSIRYGMPPKKLLHIAKAAFEDEYDEDFIRKWLLVFYRRFFTQQFKRSCVPDGPKVGSVSLSPRGDWRMPSDADVSAWLAELEEE